MSGTYSETPIHANYENWTVHYPKVCVHYPKTIARPRGIFFKQSPFDHIFPILLVQIILVFVISRALHILLKPLRQPRIVSNILAGVIIGPSVLGRNKMFMETIFPPKEMLVFNTLATLGSIYYIFIMAVKMDTTIFLRMAKSSSWGIGISAFAASFAGILLFNSLITKHISDCFSGVPLSFIANILATTYFPIVAHVMEARDLITTELGQVALSSAMLIELINHILSCVIMIFSAPHYLEAIITAIIIVVPLLFVMFVVKPAVLLISKRTPKEKPVQEIYVATVIVGAMVMVFVLDFAWGTYLPGAFLLGIIIPDGPLGATLVEKSELMIMEFFLLVFFAQVGYNTDATSIKNIQTLIYLSLFLAICYLVKILGVLLASLFLNIKLRNAFLLGVILNFKGIFEFAVYHRLRSEMLLSTQCYSTMVLFSLSFIIIFSPSINILYTPQVRLTESRSKAKFLRTLQTTPQVGELRVITSIYHEDNVHGIINLLEALNPPNSSSLIRADVIHAIELIGRSAPLFIPYKIHKMKETTTDHIMRAFVNYSRKSHGLVSLHPFIMVAPYKTMHNIICNLAEDGQVPLVVVPFYMNQEVGHTGTRLLRDFNTRLQENAPCTVGILLHKGLHHRTNLDNYFCTVAVLFLGGADDREALALGMRMSLNPKVKITLLRINAEKGNDHDRDKEKDRDEKERQVEELLVKKFQERNVDNANVTCYEVFANDSLSMLDVIRSLENKYDLVMVGKNHHNTQFEKELLEWMEYPEFGIIGDMFFSSNDFNTSKLSVLVVQHSKLGDKPISSSSKRSKCTSNNRIQNI